jgi:sugar/nucleoside kinase (ribokinase family)
MQPEESTTILSSAFNTDILDLVIVNKIRDIGRRILDSGVKILLIKAGKHGAYLLTSDISSINEKNGLKLNKEKWNNCELWCNAYKTDPLKIENSSGAGDTAAAAFLTAILQCQNPDSSVKYAAMAGRNNLYCKNIYDDLNDWQEMTEEIKSEENELIYF